MTGVHFYHHRKCLKYSDVEFIISVVGGGGGDLVSIWCVCVCDTEFKWWHQNGLTSQQACCYTEPRSTDMGIAIRFQVKVEASIVSHPWQFQMQIVCKIPER